MNSGGRDTQNDDMDLVKIMDELFKALGERLDQRRYRRLEMFNKNALIEPPTKMGGRLEEFAERLDGLTLDALLGFIAILNLTPTLGQRAFEWVAHAGRYTHTKLYSKLSSFSKRFTGSSGDW